MLDGADFIEVYRMLRRRPRLPPRKPAFDIAARVFRSGGLAKDAIYLRVPRVIELVAAGASLDPFWLGKIAPGHVPAIEELLQRGLVQPPLFKPEFLQRDGRPAPHRQHRRRSVFAKMLDAE